MSRVLDRRSSAALVGFVLVIGWVRGSLRWPRVPPRASSRAADCA